MGTHYTKEQRATYIAAFRRSGLTQTNFCKKFKMNPKTLSRWVNMELKNQSVDVAKSSKTPSNLDVAEESGLDDSLNIKAQPGFIPVNVVDGADFKSNEDHETSNPFERSASNNSAVISLKIKGFCMDIPMNFATQKNVTGVKSLIQILHQLPSDISL